MRPEEKYGAVVAFIILLYFIMWNGLDIAELQTWQEKEARKVILDQTRVR